MTCELICETLFSTPEMLTMGWIERTAPWNYSIQPDIRVTFDKYVRNRESRSIMTRLNSLVIACALAGAAGFSATEKILAQAAPAGKSASKASKTAPKSNLSAEQKTALDEIRKL